MKKNLIKKIAKAVLTIVFVASFLLMCGESDNLDANIAWTLGWMAVMVISARGLRKLGAWDKED